MKQSQRSVEEIAEDVKEFLTNSSAISSLLIPSINSSNKKMVSLSFTHNAICSMVGDIWNDEEKDGIEQFLFLI